MGQLETENLRMQIFPLSVWLFKQIFRFFYAKNQSHILYPMRWKKNPFVFVNIYVKKLLNSTSIYVTVSHRIHPGYNIDMHIPPTSHHIALYRIDVPISRYLSFTYIQYIKFVKKKSVPEPGGEKARSQKNEHNIKIYARFIFDVSST